MAQAIDFANHCFVDITSGFLIVKSFSKLYRDFVTHPFFYQELRNQYVRDIYALPWNDRAAHEYSIQYRGLDRDALVPAVKDSEIAEEFRRELYKDGPADWINNNNRYIYIPAEIRMEELGKESRCLDGFLFDLDSVNDILSYLEDPHEYEVIWARVAGTPCQIPEGYYSLGFEPTWFTGDHFSAICDCMFFPRCHGCDEEGVLFDAYFKMLNRHGLFDSAAVAQDYLNYYLTIDGTEHDGEYDIAEVFVLKNPG